MFYPGAVEVSGVEWSAALRPVAAQLSNVDDCDATARPRRYTPAMTGVTQQSIQLLTPDEPLYLQSWARVPVDVPVGVPGVDLNLDDLLILVESCSDVGCGVSHSRDGTFDADSPTWCLMCLSWRFIHLCSGRRMSSESSGRRRPSRWATVYSVSTAWRLLLIGEHGVTLQSFDVVGTCEAGHRFPPNTNGLTSRLLPAPRLRAPELKS